MDVQIPGYTIIRPIGKGGMAIVYLAYQHNLERHVALKVLTPTLAANPDFCDRFIREAKIGASLCQRNIVPVFDVGYYLLHRYMAMEYLPNGDLTQLVTEGCDTGTVLRIVYDIACALEYSHAKSFLHRDIKPANILFREDQTAVLTDFGIALDLKSAAAAGSGDGIIAGSPRYMSPEQARAEALDVRSDIYSLGVVLYEALSRKPLLEPSSTIADAVRHSTDPVPRLPGDVSWLQPILERMLAKNPAQRFSSMGEVVRSLEPCLKVPESLLGTPRQHHIKETNLAPPPLPELRYTRENVRARHDEVDEGAETRLLPNTGPTLIDEPTEDMYDEADLERALADCPPPVSSVPLDWRPPEHRSRAAGIVLLIAALAALPLAWRYWPGLSENVAPLLANLSAPEQSPQPSDTPSAGAQYSGVLDRSESLMAEADSAPVSIAVGEPTAANDAAPVPEPAVAAAPVSAKSAKIATPAVAAVDTTKVEDVAKPEEPKADPVEELLQQADDALKSQQTSPQVGTAYEKYREVLSMDPRNRSARQGLQVVASKYLELASKALNQDELESAQQYVDRASSIASRHRLGFQITQRIDDLQHTISRIRYLDG
ncbi:MAG TPA: serine/threonine-protein kinase [Dongiaceae bacterium]|nr:serine/threonine-protein kinase [Dongiaceae bacterium]